MMINIADRITEERNRLGISKAELARRLRVTSATVGQWEAGEIKTISGENLLALAKALRVTPDWLLKGRGQKSPSAGVALVDSDAPSPDAIEIARQYQQLMPMHQELVANLIKQALEAQRALAEAQGGIADTVAEVMVAQMKK